MSNFRFTPAVLMVMALSATGYERGRLLQLATVRPQQRTSVNQRKQRKARRQRWANGDRKAFW